MSTPERWTIPKRIPELNLDPTSDAVISEPSEVRKVTHPEYGWPGFQLISFGKPSRPAWFAEEEQTGRLFMIIELQKNAREADPQEAFNSRPGIKTTDVKTRFVQEIGKFGAVIFPLSTEDLDEKSGNQIFFIYEKRKSDVVDLENGTLRQSYDIFRASLEDPDFPLDSI